MLSKKPATEQEEPLVFSCCRKTRKYPGPAMGRLSWERSGGMVWEQRVRRISWVFFILMWIPLGIVVYSAVTEVEEPPVFALAALFLSVILFAALQVGSFGIGWLEKEKIRKKGIPARATVLSVSDTGTIVNNQPLLRIGLEVQPPYDSRFVATVEYIVPYSFLPQVQPGNTLQVFYLEDSKEVAIADL